LIIKKGFQRFYSRRIKATYQVDITNKIDYTYQWHIQRNKKKYPTIPLITKQQIIDLFLKEDFCYYCDTKLDYGVSAKKHRKPAIDHKNPLIRNGNNESTNLVVSCYICNQKKGILTEEEFKKNN
jgi:5-methylcytosine-specific restriction endonuclease McrA